MPERRPEREAQDEGNRSGARRAVQGLPPDKDLPPTPPVLAQRPRISTGRYSIIPPPETGEKKNN